jgi:two-component system chemotaxis sensor kinase CheA
LGQLYKGVRGISGATIMGDGRVALILDLQALSKGAEEKERLLAY